jgi:prophage tail gpP-like protein
MDFSLTRSVQAVPMHLTCTYANTYAGVKAEFVRGDNIKAYLGSLLIFTGTIDRVSYKISTKQHLVAIQARSLVRQLVDCSIDLAVSGSQVLQGTVFSTAQRLAAPFGVNVINKSEQDLPVVPNYIFQYGQTPWSAIEIAARYSGVLLLDNEFGDLVIDDVATRKHSSGVALGTNVEECSTDFSEASMYSDYYAVWETPETFLGQYATAQQHGYEKDPSVTSHRPLYFISEQTNGGQDIAQKRATYERNVRFGHGYTAQVIIDSFTDSVGVLWHPNRLIDVDLPQAGMPGKELVIVDATFVGGLNGTRAVLNMMPAIGLTPAPVSLDQTVFSLKPAATAPATPAAADVASANEAQSDHSPGY